MKSGEDGLLHLDALAAALDGKVAAVMLTNPNTLGLFEAEIEAIAARDPRRRRPALHGRRQHERPRRAACGRATSAST